MQSSSLVQVVGDGSFKAAISLPVLSSSAASIVEKAPSFGSVVILSTSLFLRLHSETTEPAASK